VKRARHQTSRKPKAQTPKRGRRIWLWNLVAAGCLGIALIFWQAPRQPEPPVVPLGTLDPELRQLIETSRVAVVHAPKSGAVWGRLGEALHAAEFFVEARFCYSNAVARDPQNFRWPYLVGILEQQGDPELAVLHLTRATELAGTGTESPRYQLARTLVERGQFDQAEPHLKMLLARNPGHAAASVELARVHLARGAFKEATLVLQPALTNHLTMRASLLLGSQIAQRNGQTEVATQLSRRAQSLPRPFDWPDKTLLEVQGLRTDRARLAELANKLLQRREFPEAEAALQKLLRATPDDPEGLLLMGRLNYLQQRCQEAETAYRKYLKAQPDSLNGLIQLGLALMCQEQWTNAAAVFEQAITLKPDFAQAHSNLGLARSKAGDMAGAIRAFRDALRTSPGDVNAHLNLAEELANAGQLEAAKQHITNAVALSPKDPRVIKAREQLGLK
jgi:protein O-GlcNAc transferase